RARNQLLQRGEDLAASQGLVPGQVTQVPADFCRINVNSADDVRPRFCGSQFQGFQADGTQSKLRDFDFPVHCPGSFWRELQTRSTTDWGDHSRLALEERPFPHRFGDDRRWGTE